jgi:hypothetical protein
MHPGQSARPTDATLGHGFDDLGVFVPRVHLRSKARLPLAGHRLAAPAVLGGRVLHEDHHALNVVEQRLHESDQDLVAHSFVLRHVEFHHQVAPGFPAACRLSSFSHDPVQRGRIEVLASGQDARDVPVDNRTTIEQV